MIRGPTDEEVATWRMLAEQGFEAPCYYGRMTICDRDGREVLKVHRLPGLAPEFLLPVDPNCTDWIPLERLDQIPYGYRYIVWMHFG